MIALTSHADGHMSLRADDIRDLPDLLKELAEMGIDLSDCSKALKEIEEEQRQKQEEQKKRNAIAERAASRSRALRAWRPAMRNFIIAYNPAKDGSKLRVAEGVVYSDGRVNSSAGWPYFAAESIDELKKYGEEVGYECSIEFIDE